MPKEMSYISREAGGKFKSHGVGGGEEKEGSAQKALKREKIEMNITVGMLGGPERTPMTQRKSGAGKKKKNSRASESVDTSRGREWRVLRSVGG